MLSSELNDLVEDALRFALTHRVICDTVPLQLYNSALIFSPEQSQVRKNFSYEISANIGLFPSSFQQWDARLFSIPNIAAAGSELKVSPDGRRLAMSQTNDTILILDSYTGHTVSEFKAHQPLRSILGFDANCKHLATMNRKVQNIASVVIWNIHTGESIISLETHADIVFPSQDMRYLVLVEPFGPVRICDPWDGSVKYTIDQRHVNGRIEWIDFGVTKSGTPCLFSIISRGHPYKGSRLYRPEVVVRNPQTGQVIARVPLASNWHKSHATLNPDGKRLLIAQQEKVQLWDGELLTDLRDPFGREESPSCFGITWATDGRSFAMSTGKAVIVYDATKQAQIGRLALQRDGRPHLCYVSATDLAVLDSGSLQMLRVRSASNEATFVYEQSSRPIPYFNPGPNGQLELSTYGTDMEIVITEPNNTLRRFRIPGSYNRGGAVFSRDHQYAFVDGGGLINIWDTKSCICVHKLRGHASDTRSSGIILEFNPFNQLVSANDEDGRIRIWDPTTGNCLHVFESQHWASSLQLASSADGRIAIVSELERALYTWGSDRVDGEKTEWILPNTLMRLSFSSKGLLGILWTSSYVVRCLSILDLSRGTCLVTYRLSLLSDDVRFETGSNFRIDVNEGVLDLDLERLPKPKEEVVEQRFKLRNPSDQTPVWNRHFLRVHYTDTEAWLMRGSKKVLWIPHSTRRSFKMTANFDTGVSMATMIYSSHMLIFHFRGS